MNVGVLSKIYGATEIEKKYLHETHAMQKYERA